MTLLCKPVNGLSEKEDYVVVFEHGEFSTPVRILSGYDAMMLSCNLACSLDNDRIEFIIERLQKMLEN